MPACSIDHLTVTAPSLEAGAAFVEQALGVPLQPGGRHARMGTHNRLLRLGESLYLEVIAPDPAAPAPGRPRWFGLDGLAADARPRLATWVARTDDIAASLAAASEPLGAAEPMARGDLRWLITIPADGQLHLGGVAPALIQWQQPAHPAASLQDHGCSLVRLQSCTPQPARVEALLASLGLGAALQVQVQVQALPAGEPARLVAHIDTPAGRRLLSCS
jgi:hypothetical protein